MYIGESVLNQKSILPYKQEDSAAENSNLQANHGVYTPQTMNRQQFTNYRSPSGQRDNNFSPNPNPADVSYHMNNVSQN